MTDPIYFGCVNDVGHFFHGPDLRSLDAAELGLPWEQVDGQLTPRSVTTQSAASVHHSGGWTALAVHDYTVDSRGNSNSVFFLNCGKPIPFAAALEAARAAFPSIVARIEAAAPILEAAA